MGNFGTGVLGRAKLGVAPVHISIFGDTSLGDLGYSVMVGGNRSGNRCGRSEEAELVGCDWAVARLIRIDPS